MKRKLSPLFYLFVLSSVFIGCKTNAPTTDVKPNILFFLIDDQRNDVISCAGHPFVQTPTVDKLAKNGIRFTNAFVTNAVAKGNPQNKT